MESFEFGMGPLSGSDRCPLPDFPCQSKSFSGSSHTASNPCAAFFALQSFPYLKDKMNTKVIVFYFSFLSIRRRIKAKEGRKRKNHGSVFASLLLSFPFLSPFPFLLPFLFLSFSFLSFPFLSFSLSEGSVGGFFLSFSSPRSKGSSFPFLLPLLSFPSLPFFHFLLLPSEGFPFFLFSFLSHLLVLPLPFPFFLSFFRRYLSSLLSFPFLSFSFLLFPFLFSRLPPATALNYRMSTKKSLATPPMDSRTPSLSSPLTKAQAFPSPSSPSLSSPQMKAQTFPSPSLSSPQGKAAERLQRKMAKKAAKQERVDKNKNKVPSHSPPFLSLFLAFLQV